MHQLYLELYEPESVSNNKYEPKVPYDFYYRYFKETFNYRFGSPRSDTCKKCDVLDNKLKDMTLDENERRVLAEKKLYEIKAVLIIIINSCDRVEKKANELLEACIYVAGSTKHTTASDMVNFIKFLLPKFTCAGFFGINQMVLSNFLSTTATYIIIILQFRAINPPT
ncbi:unnamed protein product [Diabrotica balteata]|uniref:Uncharacterized protein n=1 Tax=Diabrotica balteata TaxID=107213 RepID=A0A9N9X6G5_DIABA|nr:unnamed protein product [Diabrotica balteata]